MTMQFHRRNIQACCVVLALTLSASPITAQAFSQDILQQRIAAGIQINSLPAFQSWTGSPPTAGEEGRFLRGAGALDSCTTVFSVQGAGLVSLAVRWAEAVDVRVNGKTLSWRASDARYEVELFSPEAAEAFTSDVRALIAACSSAADNRASSNTAMPAAQERSSPQSPAAVASPLGDCASLTLPAATIAAACTALQDRWAREVLSTGRQPFPGYQVPLLVARSNARRAMGDLQGAIDDADEAARLAPHQWQIYGMRSLAHRAAGNAAKALEDIDTSLALEPDFSRSLRERANILIDLGREPEALMSADKAVSVAPKDAEARNLACWIRAAYHGRQLRRAQTDCEEAIRLAPGEAAYLDSRAMVRLRQERWQDAWSDYDRAVRLRPDDAHALYGRGIAALRLERAVEAAADLAAAKRMDGEIAETYARYGVEP